MFGKKLLIAALLGRIRPLAGWAVLMREVSTTADNAARAEQLM